MRTSRFSSSMFRGLCSGFLALTLTVNVCRAQWVKTNRPPGLLLYSLIAIGSDLIAETYSEGIPDNSGLFRSRDNGNTWTKISSSLPKSGVVFDPVVCGGRLFVGSDHFGAYRSPDHGETWVSANTGLPASISTHFFQVEDGNLFAAAGSATLYSSDCGTTWIVENAGWSGIGWLEAVGISGSLLLAGTTPYTGGYHGDLYRSSDMGANWAVVDSGFPYNTNFRSFAFTHGFILAGTGGKGVYRSSDNGVSWVESDSGLFRTAIPSLIVKGVDIFAGTFASVYHSENNGETWNAVGSGLPDTIQVKRLALSGDNLFVGTFEDGIWKRPLAEISSAIRPIPSAGAEGGFDRNLGATLRMGSDIRFATKTSGPVELGVYDVQGMKVSTLLAADLGAGGHITAINGQGLSGGIYFLRLKADGVLRVHRFFLGR